MADLDHNNDLSDEDDGEKGSRNKSRRELPSGAVATLKAWLLSPEHFTHPYPTPQDQVMLMQKTGIDKKQLKNWFTNARRRIWKPMLKKQLEQGKLASTGPGGGVAVPGVVPGLMVPGMDVQMQYQQSMQGQGSEMQQQVRYDTLTGAVAKVTLFLMCPNTFPALVPLDGSGSVRQSNICATSANGSCSSASVSIPTSLL